MFAGMTERVSRGKEKMRLTNSTQTRLLLRAELGQGKSRNKHVERSPRLMIGTLLQWKVIDRL